MTESNQSAKLTPLGKILSFLLIVALVGLGGYIVWTKNNPAATKTAPHAGATLRDRKSVV